MDQDQAEIEKRKPVWTCLSEFYLDTELQENDFEYIAKVFLASGYSVPELKDIDLYEVFPVLQGNLLSVAGAWAGFDQPLLHQDCQRLYKKRNNRFYRQTTRFWNRLFYWMRKDYWAQVEGKMRKG